MDTPPITWYFMIGFSLREHHRAHNDALYLSYSFLYFLDFIHECHI